MNSFDFTNGASACVKFVVIKKNKMHIPVFEGPKTETRGG
jgi:hypothetical protein